MTTPTSWTLSAAGVKEGPYAVVISDYRMPVMNGVEFLARVKNAAPDTVRIMLSGYAGFKTAMEAVNQGNIFRLLTKPCPSEIMTKALVEGIRQYRLVFAERDLLESTLRAAIRLLSELLTLTRPDAFGRASRMESLARKVAILIKASPRWKIEVVAALSQIGMIAFPDPLIHKISRRKRLRMNLRVEDSRDGSQGLPTAVLLYCPKVNPRTSPPHREIMMNKHILKCIAGMALLALIVSGQALARAESNKIPPPVPVVFKTDANFDFELRRALGRAIAGGADLNECLEAAHRIKPGDGLSWYEQWHALAQRVDAQAEKDLAAGHKVSAREGWLRASNYYRAAPFFLHGDPKDPKILSSWRKSRDVFRKAAALMPYPVDVLAIPYKNTTLPGYFIRPDASSKARKTLLVQTGFDGTGEEMFYSIGRFALRRDYNVLIFEGPGQGGALREKGLHFIHDWEKVVTPVVDYALTRKEVDPKRIALAGYSMGGYLVPRAAAFEHRLAAIVANPGIVDLAGKGFPNAKDLDWMAKHPKESNQDIEKNMAKNTDVRWFMNNGMYTCGKKTPLEFMLFWSKYNLTGVAEKITCPTLVIVSEQDIFFEVKQQKALYDLLKCPKTLLPFSGARDAGQHCQMGGNSVGESSILNWLDDTLAQVK